MADFTFNAPGTTANPYTPPSTILVMEGALQSDATGLRVASGNFYTAAAHDVNYNAASITSAIRVAQVGAGDDFYVGAVVRTGGNNGAIIGVYVSTGGNTAIMCTVDGGGNRTNISSGAALPTSLTAADILQATVAISAGTATVTFSQNGSNVTFSANTTTTYTGEASLAAGWGFDPQGSNASRINRFEGTGVAAGASSIAVISNYYRMMGRS